MMPNRTKSLALASIEVCPEPVLCAMASADLSIRPRSWLGLWRHVGLDVADTAILDEA
ncbi:hypothetical protein [Rhizobium azibense]|uniref:hypothetical protein n=1 Tax=Rhizobium azibense TaxID=1136135 RepID=UPI0014048FC4|nr:hypothetical protein [Rhizobium azibense]